MEGKCSGASGKAQHISFKNGKMVLMEQTVLHPDEMPRNMDPHLVSKNTKVGRDQKP